MPHKCTRCDSVFKDGAAIILNGCPKCGWNKFLYVKELANQEIPEQKEERSEAIPPDASNFIKEVDEIIENQPAMPEVSAIKHESKKEERSERVESVRIVSPGTYELNLESLLERNEIIMALKEDGTYIVHLPSVFQKKKH